MMRDLYTGQECYQHLRGIAVEWDEREPTPMDRAEIEMCKAIALTEIAYNLSTMRRDRARGGDW